MINSQQQKSLDEIAAAEKLRKARDKIIKMERKRVAAEAKRFGDQLLDARRKLGIPDPDGKEWGARMVNYQIGLRALALGMQETNFSIEGVHETLRKWLSNPMTDCPATDEDLKMYVDMLAEHEQKAAA